MGVARAHQSVVCGVRAKGKRGVGERGEAFGRWEQVATKSAGRLACVPLGRIRFGTGGCTRVFMTQNKSGPNSNEFIKIPHKNPKFISEYLQHSEH